MKKVIATLLVFLFTAGNIGLAQANSSHTTSLRQSINSAKLLDKHIKKLKSQLLRFKSNYKITKDKIIDDSLKRLGIMQKGLDKILSRNIDTKEASKYITAIVKSLRQINDKLKPYLKEQIEINAEAVALYKKNSAKKMAPFIPKIKSFVVGLATKIKSKEKLSLKDKEAIKILISINNYIDNLSSFQEKNFKTKQDLRLYLIENIKNIKKEVLKLKTIYKK